MDLILRVDLPIGMDKPESRSPCSHNNYLLFGLPVWAYLDRGIFIIRLLGYRIDGMPGQVVGSCKVILEDFTPMHREKNHPLLYIFRYPGMYPDLSPPTLD